MSTDDAAIAVHGLGKRFGKVEAVTDLSFRVEPGEIFGFMGHNGAGKTTTLRMLLGLTRPTAGRASVLGHDVVTATLTVRQVSGYLPAAYALPPDMTAREFLHYVAAMFAIPRAVAAARAEALLGRFGLVEHADRKLRGFSTGMTQKVGLAQALINEPRVLFLDEPTSGLDPITARGFDRLVRALVDDLGITVLMATHDLDTLLTVVDRVIVLSRGRVLADGSVREVTAVDDEWVRRYFSVRTMTQGDLGDGS